MQRSKKVAKRATSSGLKAAVHRAKPLSRTGVLERMFTLAFGRLVHPRVWEDPVVDMKALEIGPGHQVIAIASGGLSLTDPAASLRSISTARILRSGD